MQYIFSMNDTYLHIKQHCKKISVEVRLLCFPFSALKKPHKSSFLISEYEKMKSEVF